MSKVEERFMLLAIKKAREGIRKGQTPFGACVVKENKVVGLAHNSVWNSTDITAHAEINAIRKACRELKSVDLSGCVIYSTCEPCPMCFSACHWARISTIVFGLNIEDAKKAGFNELAIGNKAMKKLGKGKVKIIGGFLKNENLGLFKFWSSRKEKKLY